MTNISNGRMTTHNSPSLIFRINIAIKIPINKNPPWINVAITVTNMSLIASVSLVTLETILPAGVLSKYFNPSD